MNRSTLLSATDDLSVSRFDHPPGEVHSDPDHEVADHWGVAFVERGSFDLRCEGRRVPLRAGGVLLTRPGLEFNCHHGQHCPDDVCLAVRFEDTALAGLQDPWFQQGRLVRRVSSPRLALVHQRLAHAVLRADTLATERWAIAALDALVAERAGLHTRGPYLPRRDDLDAVLATCRAIEQQPAARQSIASRARAVHLTSARLTHAFRRYLGVSPHDYVIRWRLVTATDLLDAKCSVTETCYRSGFDNLSHFCRTFRRVVGVRPSEWQRTAAAERRRKVQAILRAGS
jgi:AraC-like DNA-binding protein